MKSENTLIINRELADFDFLATHKDLEELLKIYKSELKPEGKVYLFIDEVQMIEGWEKTVNSCSQDYAEEYEVFVSGSNSRLLSGRYVCFEILPFSFSEYAGISGRGADKACYTEYMSGGGLPGKLADCSNKIRKTVKYSSSRVILPAVQPSRDATVTSKLYYL